MRATVDMSRRDLLKVGALGSAAIALPLQRAADTKGLTRLPQSALPKPFTQPFSIPVEAKPKFTRDNVDYYEMDMKPTYAEIIPGFQTEFWGYDGQIPGPTIRVQRGREVVVRHCNTLPAVHPRLGYENWTSVHLHGSASLPQYDGYASDITRKDEYKDYRYPNFQDARTLWYHDHGIHHTAENAYMGLAGMYIMHDELEQSLPIPHGKYDVPFIIRDALFDGQGQLLYVDNGHSSVHGDVLLVNGVPWPTMKVERRKYRFRFLNASISRGYTFALSTGDAMTIIGTDAGLMQKPQRVSSFRMGMAERYEVVIDFAKYKPGQRVILRNLGVKNSVDFATTRQVCAFDVIDSMGDPENNEIPAVLNPNAPAMELTPSMAKKVRRFEFIRKNGQWTVNGKTWKDVEASNYELVWADPVVNDVEIWEFVNKSGGWFHPVHVHLVDFKVLSRNGRPAFPWEQGGKDVVYTGENETVRVIARFGPQVGKYMIHCHNLVHEDHDMMAQFRVKPADAAWVPGTPDPNDPIYADPARSMTKMTPLGGSNV